DLVLQLHRADPLAAGLDDVLRAVPQPDVAVRVDRGDVAGLEPTVLGERLGGALVVVVAGGDPRAADLQLAGGLPVPGLLLAGDRIGDAGLDTEERLAHGRPQVRHAVLVEAGGDGRLDVSGRRD